MTRCVDLQSRNEWVTVKTWGALSLRRPKPESDARSARQAAGWFRVLLVFLLSTLSGACSNSRGGSGENVSRRSEAVLMEVRPTKSITGKLNGATVPFSPNHWETVALAVPPNRANCGSNGAVFFKPAGALSASSDYQWGQVWKASLACIRNPVGSNCDADLIKIGNPPGGTTYKPETYFRGSPARQQTFYVAGNDARFARLGDGSLLLLSQGLAVSAGGFDPRGAIGLYVSTDCGTTWALRSVIDVKYDFANGAYHDFSKQRGGDYPFLHVDPWRGTAYILLGGNGDVDTKTLLLVSKDHARTWNLVTDPATGLSPIPKSGQRMTTLPTGEGVIAGCEGSSLNVRWYDPTANTVTLAGTLGVSCSWLSPQQIGNDPDEGALRDGNTGIVRASQTSVRIMYPTVQNNRQRIAFVDVSVSGGSVVGAGQSLFITPSSATGSVIHATLMEADYADVSPTQTPYRSAAYWLETTTTNPLWGTQQTVTPRARVFSFDGASDTTIGSSFTGITEQGDYLMGGMYYDSSTQMMGFVAPWMTGSSNLSNLKATALEWSESLTACPAPSAASGSCSIACPCFEGEADCNFNNDCAPGLVCADDVGQDYGHASSTADVCAPAACDPNPNEPGTTEFCSTTCRCATGKGDCDAHSECLPGLVCGRQNGGGFGLPHNYDVCVPAHCTDWVQNGNETSVDRGGSCGSPTCPLPPVNGTAIVGSSCKGALNQGECELDTDCANPSLACNGGICQCRSTASSNGGLEYCSSACPCAEGRGYCASDSECAAGLSCVGSQFGSHVPNLYGMSNQQKNRDPYISVDIIVSDRKVCVPTTCGMQRASGAMATPGHADFCTNECRCARGYGHCSSSAECLPGLVCESGLGPNFGYSVETSVCVPSHCTNSTKDADETFADCGGRDCGACDQPVSRALWGTSVPQPRPLTLFRRTTGEWLEGAWDPANSLTRTSIATRLLSNPVYADFGGDGTLDRGVYLANLPFYYYNNNANSPTTGTVQVALGDIPAPGKYDSGASFDVGWYRPSNNTWYVRSPSNSTLMPNFALGASGDVPALGDYDGDGRYDYALFRPSNGQWIIRSTANSAELWANTFLGQTGDIPMPGDYNGDGRSDFAVFRPAPPSISYLEHEVARFIILLSGESTPTEKLFGQYLDIPVAGDFNQDGKSDIAVYRPITAQWFATDLNGSFWWVRTWGDKKTVAPPQ